MRMLARVVDRLDAFPLFFVLQYHSRIVAEQDVLIY